MTADPISVLDWRRLPAAAVTSLITAEMTLWRDTLAWDVAESWAPLEPARAEGRLPGAVAFDAAGAPVGWTCFLRHRDALQVAMLVASSPVATRRLVEAIRHSPEAAGTAVHVVFARDAAPGLDAALAAWGFGVAPYRYLSRSTAGLDADADLGARDGDGVRDWSPGDQGALADLCARAYGPSSGLRAFAPRGTREEWLDYVGTLVGGTACGRLVPEASGVVPAADDNGLDAAVVLTSLGGGVAHVAQMAVDPAARRRGLARALIGRAVARARDRGHHTVTLLVAEANAPASGLYARLGFVDRGRFLAAVNDQPRRSTSVAPETGGASTRR